MVGRAQSVVMVGRVQSVVMVGRIQSVLGGLALSVAIAEWLSAPGDCQQFLLCVPVGFCFYSV